MTQYYKLTDQDGKTRGDIQWGEGITHKAVGIGNALCSPDVIHVYDHPNKASLFNPIHTNFSSPLLWEVKVKQVVADDGLKVGVKECMTIKQIPLPVFSITQRIAFAILVAKEVCSDGKWNTWADNWLSGKDRAEAAAWWAAAWWAATGAAAWWAAAGAAAGWAAAWWAAAAARAAAGAAPDLDFVQLSKKALKY